MRDESNTTPNSSARLSQSPWSVIAVKACANYRLRVTFADGTNGEIHMHRLIESADAGVFAALRDPTVFDRVFIDAGAVTWPGDIDIAPDAAYDAIAARGVWRP